MQFQSRMEKRLRKVQSRFYPGDLMTRNLRSVMAEISPTRVVYPDNWQVKFILNLFLFLCCLLGGPWRGSVGVVREPVRIVVRGPGLYGGPWTGGQCFRVTQGRWVEI